MDCLKILSRLLVGFSNYLYKCHASSLSSSLRLLHFLRFLHSWLQNDWAVTLSAAAPHYREHSVKLCTSHITAQCTWHCRDWSANWTVQAAHTHTRQFQLCAFNCWKLAPPLLKSQRATQVSDPSCNVFFNTRKCKDMALNLPFSCSQITLCEIVHSRASLWLSWSDLMSLRRHQLWLRNPRYFVAWWSSWCASCRLIVLQAFCWVTLHPL